MFPQWKGSALISGLGTESLSRITFDGRGGAKPAELRELVNQLILERKTQRQPVTQVA